MPASHPAWGAWIEIIRKYKRVEFAESHPAWGAWIEICKFVIFLL